MRYTSRVLFFGFAAASAASVLLAQDDAADIDDLEIVEEQIDTAPTPPVPACFNVRDIDNFDALSNKFVYVEGRRDNNYLLTMFGTCFGLRNATTIGISNPVSRVCSNSNAELSYRDFDRVESCLIQMIESVPDKEAARLLVERRRQQN